METRFRYRDSMSQTWNVKLGSLWRTHKVQGRRAAPFVKAGELTAADGRLDLTTKYDPPGSGWLAAGAAFLTGILVIFGAQALGVCAGPGWLLWFIGIAMLRRRTVTLNLLEADAAVIDPANRRLAFRGNFEGKHRWVAIDVPANFDEAAQPVAAQLPERVSQDRIERALTSASIAMIVIAILFAVMIAVSVIAAAIFMNRRPPRTMPVVSMVTESYGGCLAAISFLPGFARRTRCTGG
ncbi:MAG: hypothetical protein ACXWID_07675 [Pyrinomonadaceae bacterium]